MPIQCRLECECDHTASTGPDYHWGIGRLDERGGEKWRRVVRIERAFDTSLARDNTAPRRVGVADEAARPRWSPLDARNPFIKWFRSEERERRAQTRAHPPFSCWPFRLWNGNWIGACVWACMCPWQRISRSPAACSKLQPFRPLRDPRRSTSALINQPAEWWASRAASASINWAQIASRAALRLEWRRRRTRREEGEEEAKGKHEHH